MTLPTVTEAFLENAKRAHLQASVWKHALNLDPLLVDPHELSWLCDDTSKSLFPTTVLDGIEVALTHILKLIRCYCESDTPCKYRICGCSNAQLACTIVCACYAAGICHNELNKTVTDNNENVDTELLLNARANTYQIFGL
jgi:hypothetical protein